LHGGGEGLGDEGGGVGGFDEVDGGEVVEVAEGLALALAIGVGALAVLPAAGGGGDAEGPALFEEEWVEVGVFAEEVGDLVGEVGRVGGG
jgi:hypothetical protein